MTVWKRKANQSIAQAVLGAALMALLAGCTLKIDEQQFIARSDGHTAYTQEFVGKLTHAMAPSKVSQIAFTTADKVNLKGFYIDNPNSETMLVFFQGNGMKVEPHSLSVLSKLAELQTDIVVIDRRGLGASEGSPTIDNLLSDAQAQLAYLQQTYQPKQLVLHGYSLGSFIAGQLAKSNQIDALVMHGSATNVDDWVDEKTPWYMPFVDIEVVGNFRQVDNQQVLAKYYKGPLLVIGGENDDMVPVELSNKLYQASQSSNKELIIVPDATHTNMLDDEQTMAKYQAFLQTL
ncbi:alpha/beta hydrolase [Shewanella sp. WXL01]|uniref:alpha/beta hydrolase n=1 Tax=Shewanella sp. WXL01 TaxID=2709721 RepID=UPI0014384D90|nr:alpha/beta hydrolase [Shewanella sp. WXL01]NKF49015.1 alpha/beta hydrolase [Shewanella sp. WXL01]